MNDSRADDMADPWVRLSDRLWGQNRTEGDPEVNRKPLNPDPETRAKWREDAEAVTARIALTEYAEAERERANKAEAERDEYKARYTELKNALNWDTTCLNCSNLMDKNYEAERRGAEKALREAATDPTLRLSGHGGISVTRLRARADQIGGVIPDSGEGRVT